MKVSRTVYIYFAFKLTYDKINNYFARKQNAFWKFLTLFNSIYDKAVLVKRSIKLSAVQYNFYVKIHQTSIFPYQDDKIGGLVLHPLFCCSSTPSPYCLHKKNLNLIPSTSFCALRHFSKEPFPDYIFINPFLVQSSKHFICEK